MYNEFQVHVEYPIIPGNCTQDILVMRALEPEQVARLKANSSESVHMFDISLSIA